MLLYIYHYNEGYGRGIANDIELSLESVQRQLDKLEKNKILASKKLGRTLVFTWNQKSRVSKQLKELVATVYDSIPMEERARIFSKRRRPRSKDKPVIES